MKNYRDLLSQAMQQNDRDQFDSIMVDAIETCTHRLSDRCNELDLKNNAPFILAAIQLLERSLESVLSPQEQAIAQKLGRLVEVTTIVMPGRGGIQ